MLTRAYRLTDKLGIALIKATSGLFEIALQRAADSRSSLHRLAKNTFSVIVGALAIIMGGLLRLIKRLWAVLRWIMLRFWAVVVTVLGVIGGATQRTLRTGRRAARQSPSMGRSAGAKAATGNETKYSGIVDVEIIEDPLRAQNRVLSGLIVVVLGGLIIAVIWATSLTNTTPQPPSAPGQLNFNLGAATAVNNAGDVSADSLILPTPVPTATEIPTVLQAGGTMFYTQRERGQTDIWGVPIGTRNAVRLTNSPEDERDPKVSPDGRLLAYASRQEDSNWDIYVLDLATQNTLRLTYNLAFDGGPDWSPDSEFLVYETYQRGTHLDIFVMRADGSEPPQRLPGSSDAPDFSPAWAPAPGRQIAFTSWRDGSKDIFVFDLDSGITRNVTNTPNRDEDHPVWSPDGNYLAYSATEAGTERIFIHPMDVSNGSPFVFRQGREPTWSPDGTSLAFAVDAPNETFITVAPFVEGGVATEVIQVPPGTLDLDWASAPLAPALLNAGGLPAPIREPLFVEQFPPAVGDPPYALDTIVNVEGVESPVLSERVNDSFNALRVRVNEEAGWDFLGELTDAFWGLDRRREPGEPARNWHYTGRAVSFNRNQGGFPADYEIVMESDGINTYWRVYVRVAEEAQNGQLGEPLREMPWDFAARDSGDVEAYNQGGRLRDRVPEGYFIDLTRIAQDYGWQRAAASTDWRNNFNGRNFWTLQKREDLMWYEAMREIYAESELGGFVPTPTPAPTVENEESDDA
ncbi:MAG: hypothetical protein ACOCX5_02385 [Chloroflexota bacterium]